MSGEFPNRMRRIIVLIGASYTALFAFYGGVGLLLQRKIAILAPDSRALTFALVAGAVGLCSTVANPVGGLLSDRTHSRVGPRAPWMLVGSVVAFGATITISHITTVLPLAV